MRMAQNNRGSVLIFVLIFMAFIIFTGSMQAGHSLIEARVAGNYVHNAQAYYAAEAGVEGALAVLQSHTGLGEGFLLQGTAGRGSFRVTAETGPDGSIITSQGFAANAREVILVEAGYADFPGGDRLAVKELALMGSARVEGGLHIQGAFAVGGEGNSVEGPFTFNQGGPAFAEGASLFLEESQMLATKASDLASYQVEAGYPVFSFYSDFYREKGYPAFATLEDYLRESGMVPLATMRITQRLDTSTLEENISFHGVLVVTSSNPVVLSGSINSGEADAENQVVIVATQSQDIILCPSPEGELRLGGTFFLLTRGDIFVQGPPGLETENVQLRGAVACRRLSLREGTFVYAPKLQTDIWQEIRNLPLLEARWLRTH